MWTLLSSLLRHPFQVGFWSQALMQLLLALVVPAVLLVGLTALLASGRLSLSRNAAWLLERQNTIWMAGIVALAVAAVLVALQR